ncbi:MAG: FtsX-like permease family protein [Ruminococcaceae bacterium]|nr:FtsX-like permease family protein [Oscillospiraceae bacterium]
MSKMLFKNILRDINKTKARFVSIMLIILLGVGFLVGISSTAPSMYAVADKYYKDTNLMDLCLISTVGFTEKDIAAVKRTPGVEDVMPSYFADVLLKGESDKVVRLYAVPEAYKGNSIINEITLKEGRLPENEKEILVDSSGFNNITVGSQVSFDSPDKTKGLSDTLKEETFTVVGVVDSPMYISFERGVTNVGSGKISAYMMVLPESFATPRYTQLFVTGEDTKNFEPYSPEYESARDDLKENLEKTAEMRKDAFSEEMVASAQASLDEAKLTFENEKQKAEKELADAQNKIDEGRATFILEVQSAEKKLSDAKVQIDTGRTELADKKAQVKAETEEAEKKIADGEQEIIKAEAEIKTAKETMKEEIYQKVSPYGITREQFEYIYGDRDMLTESDVNALVKIVRGYKYTVDSRIMALDIVIEELEAIFSISGKDPQTVKEYKATVSRRNNLQEESDNLSVFITTGKDDLLGIIAELSDADAKVKASRQELESAKEKLAQGKITAEEEFRSAEEKLSQAEIEYNAGVEELERVRTQTPKDLDNAQRELDTKKSQAEKEFEKAEKELRKAQKEIDAIKNPQWYINTRDDNPGFASYVDNVERVNAVGKVFPVFFMLVAVLVCVTTLSRLVEEQRGDIGALTTLGYRRKDIIFKYIVYALSATIVGAVVGIAVGVPVIPTVIYNAYRILYSSMPPLILRLNVGSAIIASLVAMVCTSAVAFFTCFALLRHKPATLLRPKSPKAGKRILLERIGFIWKRMSFFAKVTARNIFRYKARFFMTVMGVAGCTALIVSAFGLYSSINDVMDKQFGEIFTYDVIVAADDSVEYNKSLKEKVTSDSRFGNTAVCLQQVVTVSKDGVKVSTDTYMAVPESISDYTRIVNLRDRKTKEQIPFDNSGVVVTEKLATTLGVRKGDTITVEEKGKTADFTVSGICENYVYGYVFVSPDLYRQAFSQDAEFTLFMCTAKDGVSFDEDSIGKEYLDTEGVLGVSFISASVRSFEDMISSLNYVVLVMIVSAAALAFVVLYNLTNINVAERKREISTLKVLGFKDKETSAYIYRENILLCIFGILAGLLLGVWLLGFIIQTIEMDMVMFGRDIHFITFVLSALLTAVFASLVNVIMHKRLKKIDMVESLKSVE